jgi:hypothetical protein
MELFTSAGIDLPTATSRARRATPTRAGALFNARVLSHAFTRAAARFSPTPEQIATAADYARKVRDAKFNAKEVAVRPVFIADVLQTVLGYTAYDPGRPYTLASERVIRGGAVDVALGRFNTSSESDQIIAPFELKGPKTLDLDRVDPGRGRSPVQQAWDYAVDSPGSRWVLVSNCVEIRLYAFGRGRDAYERFDLSKLDQSREHERLWLILSAANLLGGTTDALLRDTDEAYQQVTDDLYRQYSALRRDLIGFLTGTEGGPKLARLPAIETAQTLLDRVLFVAFAERTDLLPAHLLEQASRERNRFNPVPLWTNFQSLFRAVDVGNDHLGIPAYNGGLFAPNPVADAVVLPDHLTTQVAALGRWDYRHEVPVTVLGHIFEQSITEIEADKASVRGEAAPTVSRRKREGVVYTPAAITRFLVDRTVGASLDERFEALRMEHRSLNPHLSAEAGDHKIWKQAVENDTAASGSTGPELAYWRACLKTLQEFTVVDPACGSGAFLIAAFDELARRYLDVVSALESLGEEPDLDIFDQIVTENLYGVDLNPESVEITRLSLWLKTARREHKLQHLTGTIKDGDSLIADRAYASKPFDWSAAFPAVFARGGFDVVIGNPPYVRMELLKKIKPYLSRNYVVSDERTDLYAYFFEKGISLLKAGGRLGFISSSTFFRTGSGTNLRTLISGEAALETVIDFGDQQVFGGVTTYPAILTMRKAEGPKGGELRFLNINGPTPDDLGRSFRTDSTPMPRARLTSGSWQFEDATLHSLRDDLIRDRPTLGEVYGSPLYGIKTGLNKAFVLDQDTRDRFVELEPWSDEILKCFLRGEDIKRWRTESAGTYLINTPKGRVDIDRYPLIRDHLVGFRSELEKRATRQEWWELQQAQAAYQDRLAQPKISYPHFQNAPMFSLETTGAFSNDKTYFIPSSDPALLGLLNSRAAWFILTGLSPAVRGGWHEMRVQYVERLPIPDLSTEERGRIGSLAQICTEAAQQRYCVERDMSSRILDLCPTARNALPRALKSWHAMSFRTFLQVLKSALKLSIPPKEQGAWAVFFTHNASRYRTLSARIHEAEREIDSILYQAFSLSAENVSALEHAIASEEVGNH